MNNYPNIDLENTDDTTLITQPSHSRQAQELKNDLADLEKKNPLLQKLKSAVEFYDRLRRIETDNLYYIQQFQSKMEDITDLDNKASK